MLHTLIAKQKISLIFYCRLETLYVERLDNSLALINQMRGTEAIPSLGNPPAMALTLEYHIRGKPVWIHIQ